ncbi:MAG TPA: hypothetical protein VFV38_51510 [Ktedonobacteraceae bacterium]|nr:hypothetical protein [Ktedonobacteraceae bacterium]
MAALESLGCVVAGLETERDCDRVGSDKGSREPMDVREAGKKAWTGCTGGGQREEHCG